MASQIRFQTGAPAGGAFTPAKGGKKAPAVLILPAVAGLNAYTSQVADRLAALGYASLVLDYYTGPGGKPDLSDRPRIMAAAAALSDSRILAEMGAGIDYLRAHPSVDPDRLAVLGFCIGGSLAILAASHFNMLKCAISFYGTLKYAAITENKPVSPIDAAANLKCPLLGHYGESDQLIPLDHVRETRELLHNRPAEIYTYPGAGHAFHEDFRPEVYRPVAANEAWRRSLEYLEWYCQGQNSS